MSSRSPPVLRSIIASAPTERAVSVFSSSASIEQRSLLVPMLAFTFVESIRPMPAGFKFVLRWSLLAGITNLPAAISSRMRAGSTFSAAATNLTSSLIVPVLAICSCHFFASAINKKSLQLEAIGQRLSKFNTAYRFPTQAYRGNDCPDQVQRVFFSDRPIGRPPLRTKTIISSCF